MYRLLLIFFLLLVSQEAAPAEKSNLWKARSFTCISSVVWKPEWVRWVKFDDSSSPVDVKKKMLRRFLRHGCKLYFICFIPINNR